MKVTYLAARSMLKRAARAALIASHLPADDTVSGFCNPFGITV